MTILQFPTRHANLQPATLSRGPRRTERSASAEAELAAFNSITVTVALSRLKAGTLEPGVLVALMAAVEIRQ